ncbi:MAG: hypothetical protein ABSG04_04955 [Verrucomicrobiota bacterium]
MTQSPGVGARNRSYWDKKAYADGCPDHSQAKVYRFLYDPVMGNVSRVLESVKEPLENRVWYNYPGRRHRRIPRPNCPPRW